MIIHEGFVGNTRSDHRCNLGSKLLLGFYGELQPLGFLKWSQ